MQRYTFPSISPNFSTKIIVSFPKETVSFPNETVSFPPKCSFIGRNETKIVNISTSFSFILFTFVAGNITLQK